MTAPTHPLRRAPRAADPYRDLAVIDARAPRFNQAVVAAATLVAIATGWWALFALAALHLTVSALLGRRWCLPCVFYFEVVQPRLGEGPLEDSRPPRFANRIGGAFLWAATLASAAGARSAGIALGGIVAALALLSAATGFCIGCTLYTVVARARGLHRLRVDRVDLAELGVPPGQAAVVEFTHPLCSECQALARRLEAERRRPVLVDVSRRPDLARKYGIGVVPLAFEVRADGAVVGRIAG